MEKHNISLWIGILIPAAMIIVIVVSIYLPTFFVHPKYSFVYSVGGYDYYQQTFDVQNGRLIKSSAPQPVSGPKPAPPYQAPPKLYIYDLPHEQSREISFEAAAKFDLDANNQSPDGFEIAAGSNTSGFFPFFFGDGQDYNSRYLTGHNYTHKLNLQIGDGYYSNFHFLGWIINN